MCCLPLLQIILTRSTGVIRKFFPERGYGFIKPDCGGYDVWIHRKFCAKGYYPQEGDRVVYLTRLGERGGFVAKEVDRIIDRAIDIGFGGVQATEISTDKRGILLQINNQFERNMAGIDLGHESGDRTLTAEEEANRLKALFQQPPSMYNALYGKRS